MHVVRPKKTAPAQPVARFAVPVDENAFVDWLIDADPGDKLVYYRGHLSHDRMPSTKVLDQQSRITLQAVADRVMAAAAQGLVLPVQKRLGPEEFLYIAVKALPRRLGSACGAAIPLPSFPQSTAVRLAA
jgi:hypothetical protein